MPSNGPFGYWTQRYLTVLDGPAAGQRVWLLPKVRFCSFPIMTGGGIVDWAHYAVTAKGLVMM